VEYEFRISAKNAVDFGDPATATLKTPDGSELLLNTQSIESVHDQQIYEDLIIFNESTQDSARLLAEF